MTRATVHRLGRGGGGSGYPKIGFFQRYSYNSYCTYIQYWLFPISYIINKTIYKHIIRKANSCVISNPCMHPRPHHCYCMNEADRRSRQTYQFQQRIPISISHAHSLGSRARAANQFDFRVTITNQVTSNEKRETCLLFKWIFSFCSVGDSSSCPDFPVIHMNSRDPLGYWILHTLHTL